jgi:hypothetical protein
MALSLSTANRLFDQHMTAAAQGSARAYFELGMSYSTGSDGVDVDLIAAHKWFNLAALAGLREGVQLRAEIATEMGASEIAEAQRQARAWIATVARGNEQAAASRAA